MYTRLYSIPLNMLKDFCLKSVERLLNAQVNICVYYSILHHIGILFGRVNHWQHQKARTCTYSGIVIDSQFLRQRKYFKLFPSKLILKKISFLKGFCKFDTTIFLNYILYFYLSMIIKYLSPQCDNIIRICSSLFYGQRTLVFSPDVCILGLLINQRLTAYQVGFSVYRPLICFLWSPFV